MATLGTFTSGQVLTAAELNAIGTWTTYTPVVEQVTTFGLTVAVSKYSRMNELVIVQMHVTIASGTGTAGNGLLVSLPLSYGGAGNPVLGNAYLYDSNVAVAYHAAVYYWGSDKVQFLGDWSANNTFGATPSIAFGVDDQIRLSIVYETDA